ncbi:MAG: Ig-like domain-containing protein [Burkholderiales bacterium]
MALPGPRDVASVGQPASDRRDLIVIDSRVAGAQEAARRAPPGVQVLILDAEADALSTIAGAAGAQPGWSAIHLIAHGEPGHLLLGRAGLDTDSVRRSSTDLAALGATLRADGDILIYGCDVAADAIGARLIATLADLTGADVAGSTDPVGEVGGRTDWSLETASGPVELAFDGSSPVLAAVAGALTTAPTVTDGATAPRITAEETAVAVTGLTISDPEGENQTVTVTAGHGRVALGSTAGLASHSGGGTATLTFSGTLASVNVALATLTYTPDTDFSGTETLTVQSDDGNQTGAATLDIGVTSLDDAPVTAPTALTVAEGGSQTFSATNFGIADVDNSDVQLIVKIASLPTHGALRLGGARLVVGSTFSYDQVANLTYTHDGSQATAVSGTTDSFTFTVNDGAGSTVGPSVLPITLTPVNQAPAVSGTTQLFEGQTDVPVTVVLTDADQAAGAPYTLRIESLPAVGTLRFNGSPVVAGVTTLTSAQLAQLTYSHDGSEPAGPVTFTIRATDDGGGSATPLSTAGTITLSVRPNDDDPVLATNSPAALAGGNTVVLNGTNLHLTDPDSGDANLTYIVTAAPAPAKGSLQIDKGSGFVNAVAGSTFTQADVDAGRVRYFYQSATDFPSGTTDTFQFQVRDGAIREYPTVREGGIHLPDDTTLRTHTFTINIAAAATENVANGAGTDVPNAAPQLSGAGFVNVGITSADLSEGGTVTIHGTGAVTGPRIVVPDSDNSAAEIVYRLTQLPTSGEVRLNGAALGLYGVFTQDDLDNGRITFVHGGGEDFIDEFRATVSDGQSTTGALVFGIDVTPVNDRPTIAASGTPFMEEGAAYVFGGGNVGFAMSDVDGSGDKTGATAFQSTASQLVFRVTTLPAHGAVAWSADGTTWTTITGANQATVTVTAADIAGGRFRYVHDGSENFADSFQVQADDGKAQGNSLSTIATVSLEIAKLNDPPAPSENVSLTVAEGGTGAIGGAGALGPRLAYTDPDNTVIQRQYRITTATAHGTLLRNGAALGLGSVFTQDDLDNNRITYRHDGTENYADEFAFNVDDGGAPPVPGTYQITVVPANDTPTLSAPATATIAGPSGTVGNFTLGDPDLVGTLDAGETDRVRVTVEIQDSGGTLISDARGQITLPGGVTLLRSVSGTSGASARLVFEATRANAEAALDALQLSFAGDEDQALRLSVTVDDRLYDNANAVTGANGGPANQPETGGAARPLSDANNTVTTLTTLTVSRTNDAPVLAAPASITATEDTAFAFAGGNAVTLSDADAFTSTGTTVTVSAGKGRVDVGSITGLSAVTGRASGSMQLTGSLTAINAALATLTYQGNPNFAGTDTVLVSANDGGNTGTGGALTDTRSVAVTVVPVNDAPSVSYTGPAQTIGAPGTSVVFSGASAIRIDDALDLSNATAGFRTGNNDFTVTLTSRNGASNFGTLTLGTATGLTSVTGNGTATVTLRGTRDAVNTALSGLTFAPLTSEYNGNVAARIRVVVNDNANHGTSVGGAPAGVGAALTATRDIFVPVSSINEAPSVAGPSGVSVNEDGSVPFSGANAITLSDPDAFSGRLRMTVDLGTGALGTFTFGSTSGLTVVSGGTSGATTAVLEGTLADLNAALTSMRFSPTANVNRIGTTQPLTITLNDQGTLGTGGALSATRTVPITIAPVNDAPAAAGTATVASIAEDGPSLTGSSVATLFTTNYSDAIDTVAGGSSGTAFSGIAIVGNAATAVQGKWQFSLNGGSTWRDVPTTGLGNTSALVLPTSAAVRFLPATHWNGSPGALSVRLSDGTGFSASTTGTDLKNIASGVGGTGGWSAATVAVRTTVTPVNDAPVRTTTAVALTAVDEDTASPAGATVTSLFTSAFSDARDAVSGGSAANGLAGIAIVTNAADPATEGRWQVQAAGASTWTDVGTVSTSSALLVASDARLRFVPVANYNGTPPGLLTRLADTSSGAVTTGARADVSDDSTKSGGITRYSNSGNSVTLNTSIRPVNDAPVLADRVLSAAATEDQTAPNGPVGIPVSSLTGGITDIDAGAVQGIAVTGTNAARGTWFYSIDGGTTWQTLGNVSAANARLLASDARLYFVPAPDFNGTVSDALTFRAWDRTSGTNGGTASTTTNGGTRAFSTATDQLALTVAAVQDPPVARNDSATTTEDTPVTLAGTLLLSNDTDVDGDTVRLQSVGPTSANGGTVTLNAAGNVVYAPPANFNGIDTFTYTITDGNGNTSTATVSVIVTGVNDLPTGSNSEVTLPEDTPRAFRPGDFNFRDPDRTDALSAVRIDTVPAGGVLTFDGVPVTAGQVIAFADIARLVFTPLADQSGAAYRTFQFSVRDGAGAFSATPATMTVNVTPDNDPPASTNRGVNLAEDTTYAFAAGDFPFTDTDAGDTMTAVRIDTLPGNGTLTLGGVPVTPGQVIPRAQLSQLLFTPAANATGTASLTFSVSDGTVFQTAPSTFALNLTPANDPPDSANAIVTTTEDTPYAFSGAEFAFTDPDPGDTEVAVRIDSLPAAGVLTIAGVPVTAGQVIPASELARLVYTPAADSTVQRTFTFSVYDGQSFSASPHTLTIRITGSNDAPVARADLNAISAGVATVGGNVVGAAGASAGDRADTDVDGDALTVTAWSDAFDGSAGTIGSARASTYGALTLNADGTYSFALDSTNAAVRGLGAGQTLTERFSYTVSDGHGGSAVSTLTVVISGVDEAPVTQGASRTIDEDTSYAFGATDFPFADGDAGASLQAVRIVSLPAAGTLTLAGVPVTAGQVIPTSEIARLVFTPAPDASGTNYASFTFSVTDGTGDSAPATFTFDVTPLNDPPGVRPSFEVVGLPDPSASGNALTGASDADGDTVRIVDVDGTPVTEAVPAVIADGTKGILTVASDGSYTYVADPTDADIAALEPGDSLQRTFTYRASDGHGGTASATITISITGVNDPPATAPAALTVAEDATLGFSSADFPFTDPDSTPPPKAIRIDSLPASGTLTLGGQPVAAGTVIPEDQIANLVYAPAANATGATTFQFSVTDGKAFSSPATMTLNVTPVNDLPVAIGEAGTTPEDTPLAFPVAGLLSNDSDADLDTLTISAPAGGSPGTSAHGGTVTVSGGVVTYTPAANFTGTDTFTYTVSDGRGGTATATVTVLVTPADDPPDSADATLTITEDTAYGFSGSEFAFVDGDAGDSLVAVRIDTLPAAGTLMLAGVPVGAGQTIRVADLASLVFTPAPNGSGIGYASLTFSVFDGRQFDPAPNTITFNVTPVNDAPAAVADVNRIFEDAGAAITGNVLGGAGAVTTDAADADPEGAGLTVTALMHPGTGATGTIGSGLAGSYGTLILNANGTYSYTVDNANPLVQGTKRGETLTDVFTYAVSDGTGGTTTATLTITVVGVNDAPDASDESRGAIAGVALPGQLSGTDADDDALTFSAVTAPAHGALVLNPDGSYEYTADPGFSGVDAFTYRVSDGQGGFVDRTVTLTVEARIVETLPISGGGPRPMNATLPGDADYVTVTGIPAAGTLRYADGTPVGVNETITVAQFAGLTYEADPQSTGIVTGPTFTVTRAGGTRVTRMLVFYDLGERRDPELFPSSDVRPRLPYVPQSYEPALFVLPAVRESEQIRLAQAAQAVGGRSAAEVGEVESVTLARWQEMGPGLFVTRAVAESRDERIAADARARAIASSLSLGTSTLFDAFAPFAPFAADATQSPPAAAAPAETPPSPGEEDVPAPTFTEDDALPTEAPIPPREFPGERGSGEAAPAFSDRLAQAAGRFQAQRDAWARRLASAKTAPATTTTNPRG